MVVGENITADVEDSPVAGGCSRNDKGHDREKSTRELIGRQEWLGQVQ